MNKDFKIDFIGIGVIKAATTWIFERLKEHPEICGSSIKEVRFFDRPNDYRKGVSYYRNFFEDCSKEKIKGEFTPEYIYYENVPERIYKTFPDVKIIACLRNPLERAYSHYKWAQFKKNRLGHYDSFEKAIERSPILADQGFYYQQLKRYFNIFPKENILILLYSNLKKDSESFIQKAYKFLGADPDFTPLSLNQKENPTGKVKYKQRLPMVNSILWNIWNNLNPPGGYGKTYALFKKIGLRDLGAKILKLNRTKEKESLNAKGSTLDEIDPKMREQLQDFYKEDIEKLEQLINKDLSHWKNYE